LEGVIAPDADAVSVLLVGGISADRDYAGAGGERTLCWPIEPDEGINRHLFREAGIGFDLLLAGIHSQSVSMPHDRPNPPPYSNIHRISPPKRVYGATFHLFQKHHRTRQGLRYPFRKIRHCPRKTRDRAVGVIVIGFYDQLAGVRRNVYINGF